MLKDMPWFNKVVCPLVNSVSLLMLKQMPWCNKLACLSLLGSYDLFYKSFIVVAFDSLYN
jgi:hypothetical protein